jgi:integrase
MQPNDARVMLSDGKSSLREKETIPMRQSGERVHGPYPHFNKFRLVVDRNGKREKLAFATEREALKRKEELLKEIQGRTVSDAVRAYIAHLRDRGLRASTVDRTGAHLRRFFQLDAKSETGERLHYFHTGGFVEDLHAKKCETLYAMLRGEVAVDTHRNALVAAKSFGAWCVKQGWLRSNPTEDIEPVGQRNHGKQQLRIDEARKLVDLCIAKANAGNDAAVGVLVSLLMGMRASEVTDRAVRDLDDDGRLLWIEKGKTKRSRRTLEVPAVLRPYLLALAKDRAPDEQLITRGKTKRGKKRDRQWLYHWVGQFCAEAKVPEICVHSLRGLHATLATEAGMSSHVVANALGHSSPAVTQAHYLQAGTKERVSSRRVAAKLAETLPTGTLHPVGVVEEPAGTNRSRSVPAKQKRLSRVPEPTESLGAIGGTRTPTVLPTGT